MHVAANGIRVNYDTTGPDGAPWVLCLHSLATDLHLWDRQLDVLAKRFRVLRLDMRGHGGSDGTPPPYTLDLLVADAVAALDALEIERCHVMGLSIGAMIALGIAIEHPDRVDRLIVADARSDAPPAYVGMWDAAIESISLSGIGPVIDNSMDRWFSQSFRDSDPATVERIRAIALKTSVDGFIGCARAVQKVAYLSSLDRIAAPTLFIVGENDPAASPTTMSEMASLVPGAELRVIPAAAHLTAVESPDAFTELAASFLEAHRDRTARHEVRPLPDRPVARRV